MTTVGVEYKRRTDGDPSAPEVVHAIQYKVGDTFQGKYRFLKFVGQGLSVTIYADAVVVHTKESGAVKLVDSNWILKDGRGWYFLGDPIFQKTYERVHEPEQRTSSDA